MSAADKSFDQWERAVIAAIEVQCDCSTSDAQGIMEAQEFLVTSQFHADATPDAAAAAILQAGATR